ncbi:uncharacterized protein IWZ02DRAFT_437677 [Phyllosticta citriasiana]|uniref:uncharacterized protein n=1 Tax=Phyllosticta citriasiana TaxID=595635 RepID=UPI0030FD51CD
MSSSSSSPVTITVLYPTDPDATFNHSYYTNTHMPLAEKLWTPMGMLGWRTFKHVSSPPRAPPSVPYPSIPKTPPLSLSQFFPQLTHKIRLHTPTPSAHPCPYSVVTLLEFRDLAAWDEAFALAPTQLLPDIKNYSNREPLILVGSGFGEGVSRRD